MLQSRVALPILVPLLGFPGSSGNSSDGLSVKHKERSFRCCFTRALLMLQCVLLLAVCVIVGINSRLYVQFGRWVYAKVSSMPFITKFAKSC